MTRERPRLSRIVLLCQGAVVAFSALPDAAAWRHQDARAGFEVVYFQVLDDGYQVDGYTTAVEDGQAWAVTYAIRLDPAWATRRALVIGRSAAGPRRTLLESDGAGHWWVDGAPTASLDGCLDVDLESSAVTNAFPVHRLTLDVGAEAAAPAAYVRVLDLGVERLDQTYARTADEGAHQRYDYTAPAFDFTSRLVYDRAGLVLDYPGIAVRAA